jgi:hypothetical protein
MNEEKEKKKKNANGKEGDGEIRGVKVFWGWDKSFSDRYA